MVLCISLIGGQYIREFEFARSQLEQQCADFSISRAECAVEADRSLVKSVLTTLYASLEPCHDRDSVDLFEDLLRTKVADTMKKSLSLGLPSPRVVALIGSAFAMQIYDNLAMTFQISDESLLAESTCLSSNSLPWVRAAIIVYQLSWVV